MRSVIRTAVVAALVVLLSACSREKSVSYPVFGSDSLTEIALLERGSDALARWTGRGVKKGVVVLFGGASPLGALPADHLAKLQELMARHDREGIAKGNGTLYDSSNYLSAAIALGVVSEVNWIIPDRLFDDIPLAGDKVKAFLGKSGTILTPKEISALKMDAGCLSGTVGGARLYVCSPHTLHKIDTPLLITVTAGFFPGFAASHGSSNLRAVKTVYDELAFRQCRVRDLDVVYGTADGGSPRQRYLADEFVEGAGSPKIFEADKPPELWTVRDTADNMLTGGEGRLVLDSLRKPLRKYPDDKPLRYMAAEAYLRVGDVGKAHGLVGKLCRENRAYCAPLEERGGGGKP